MPQKAQIQACLLCFPVTPDFHVTCKMCSRASETGSQPAGLGDNAVSLMKPRVAGAGGARAGKGRRTFPLVPGLGFVDDIRILTFRVRLLQSSGGMFALCVFVIKDMKHLKSHSSLL